MSYKWAGLFVCFVFFSNFLEFFLTFFFSSPPEGVKGGFGVDFIPLRPGSDQCVRQVAGILRRSPAAPPELPQSFKPGCSHQGKQGRIDVQKLLPIGSEPPAEPCSSLALNPAGKRRCRKPGEIGNAAWQQLPKVAAFCNSLVSHSVLLGRPEAGNLTSLGFENASDLLVFEFDKWPSGAEEYLTARPVDEEKASFRI